MMMLDICSPVHGINKKKVAQQMHKTHQRAQQAFQYHME
jgi:queuine/archaeosine tRNA-ribosyltransferase